MNPKDAIGSKKVSTHIIPPIATFTMGLAFMDGARKYGPYNWREQPVQASIYVDAIKRHIALWEAGEDNADDSLVAHLGHVMGCCAILLDAQNEDALIDDRQKSERTVAMLKLMNDFVKQRSA